MSEATELGDLLFQLRSVGTPLKKLKVLAHAWRTVRRLTPRERREIAAHLGVENAERLLEQMGMRDGPLTPALLLEAIHGAEQADPGKLRTLLASLSDREGRRGPLQQSLAAAGAALGTEKTPTELHQATPPPPWLPPALVEVASPKGGEEEPDGSRETSVPAPLSPLPVAGEPLVTLPPHQAGTPSHPALTQPLAPTPRMEEPSTPVEPSPDELPPPQEAAPPGDQRTDAPVFARLLELQRDRQRLALLPLARRLELAESFADGWRRRRAVQALFSKSSSLEPDEVLALLGTLAAERDRIWCLNHLLGTGRLKKETIGPILAIIPSARARSRLTLHRSVPET